MSKEQKELPSLDNVVKIVFNGGWHDSLTIEYENGEMVLVGRGHYELEQIKDFGNACEAKISSLRIFTIMRDRKYTVHLVPQPVKKRGLTEAQIKVMNLLAIDTHKYTRLKLQDKDDEYEDGDDYQGFMTLNNINKSTLRKLCEYGFVKAVDAHQNGYKGSLSYTGKIVISEAGWAYIKEKHPDMTYHVWLQHTEKRKQQRREQRAGLALARQELTASFCKGIDIGMRVSCTKSDEEATLKRATFSIYIEENQSLIIVTWQRPETQWNRETLTHDSIGDGEWIASIQGQKGLYANPNNRRSHDGTVKLTITEMDDMALAMKGAGILINRLNAAVETDSGV